MVNLSITEQDYETIPKLDPNFLVPGILGALLLNELGYLCVLSP